MDKIREYFKTDAISQSFLTDFEKDPRVGDPNATKDELDATYLRKGNAIDVLITGDPKDFQRQFYVMTSNAPTGQMLLFVKACEKYAIDSGISKVSDISVQLLQYAYEDAGVKRDSFDKFVYERFPKEGYRYLQALLSSRDKTVLTQVEAEVATAAAQSLLSNPFTSHWIAEQEELGKRYKYYYQVPVYWEYKGVKCKALIDVIRIDTAAAKVAAIDVKSTSRSTLDFEGSVLKYRYDLQAAWYTMAVNEWCIQNDLELDFDGFRFILESTIGTGRPMVYKMHPKSLLCGKIGGTDLNGRTHKGYDQLIEEYLSHKETGQWHYPKQAWDNAGEMSLNIYQ